MKKIFVLLLSAVLALSLVSCPTNGGSSVNPDNGNEQPTPSEPSTPDEPTTPETPEEPVEPQKEMCDVCGVAHYKTDKYHFDVRDDIFDWTDEKVKEYYNPLGLEEDMSKANTEFNIFFSYGNPIQLSDPKNELAYYTCEVYKNEDTMIIPRMYKNIPVRGFTSVNVNHYLWDTSKPTICLPSDEPRKDVRNLYLHKGVNYAAYCLGSWNSDVDDVNIYYEGTIEDFKNVVEKIASTTGVSGTLYTLLDGKTSKWSYHRVEEL